MNYILLKQFVGRPYLDFIPETCFTSPHKTYFYYAKHEDEVKIPELKALELLSTEHEHVLESVPRGGCWTINKLVRLLQNQHESCFILYADIDYERACGMYTGDFLENRDINTYSIIRLDP